MCADQGVVGHFLSDCSDNTMNLFNILNGANMAPSADHKTIMGRPGRKWGATASRSNLLCVRGMVRGKVKALTAYLP